ncbi:MAG: hypothetical protein K0Q63_2856 [Paenibacillus sp.]|nr:hypothetical protein [Paenibacillus sp.]
MNGQDDPKPKYHESQPSRPYVPEESYRDDHLNPLQRAEGGGPIRRVNMDQMPKPLRYFGYAIATIFLLGIVIILLTDWFS